MGDLIRGAAVAAGAATALALGVFAPAAAQATAATTLYVSQGGSDSATCASASPCATVSHALKRAASGATIKVSGAIDDHLNITSPVTITTWPGGPAGSRAVLDGTMAAGLPVVTVIPGVAGVTLHDLTIENGNGGIFNEAGAALKLTDSTVSGSFGIAGVIDDGGTMAVIDSTVTKNSSGGILNNQGTTTVIASTLSGNSYYGIASIDSGTATLGATIVAGNATADCVTGGPGSLVSAGYNLTSDKTGKACSFTQATDSANKNPLLGHLANNGGPTKTLLPAANGPADDVIPKPTTLQGAAVCPGTDQRGITRPHQGDTRCTIGAVEV